MLEIQRYDNYELLRRTSSESAQSSLLAAWERHTHATVGSRTAWKNLNGWISFPLRLAYPTLKNSRLRGYPPSKRSYRSYLRLIIAFWIFIVLLIGVTAIFQPSYTYLPEHYQVLEKKCTGSRTPGRGNVNNEKVFIAATLYDYQGSIVNGAWGISILKLVQLLGPENVHLSVYENDADELATAALFDLRNQLNCNVSLVSEHFALEDIAHVTLPSGESQVKRIAFLAEARNRALRPLRNSSVRFDKLLYINDVVFNPIDAVQLLFFTNIDASGRTQYGAACAMDFINPFKFYDRFATRDFEGHETGVPFFPWFTDAGEGASRKDVLAQKDAVRVRSCWGGMTAFEAKWFQNDIYDIKKSSKSQTPDGNIIHLLSPLSFRHEVVPFWSASECCLIHADLTYLRHGLGGSHESGIYMNPYVRVAYDSRTLGWLPYTSRLERIYPPIHNLVNLIAGLPSFNKRRLEVPGEKIVEDAWEYQQDGTRYVIVNGSRHEVQRIASPGGFCTIRATSILREDAKEGEKKWLTIPFPLPSK